MQDFNADCTINLLVLSQGKPGKYVWACSLLTRKSVRLVLARRFMGMVSSEEAEWNAVFFGLSQAARLQQEKVELSATFPLSIGVDSKGRRPEIQWKKAEAEHLWSSFRLKKTGKIHAEEERFLREEAMRAFSRKSRNEGR
jgi:hypothetical protein